MRAQQAAASLDVLKDKRRYARHRVKLSGKMFIPDLDAEQDCRVIDLSQAGVAVRCGLPPRKGSQVVLYIGGFGRFDAEVAQIHRGVVGMRIKASAKKQDDLGAKLIAYVRNGELPESRAREHDRLPVVPTLIVTRENGEVLDCEILDISLQGISLKTQATLTINELLRLGKNLGRVVRHHDLGVGVEFVNASARAL